MERAEAGRTHFGFGLTRATANARLANFASNIGSLAIFAFGGQIVLAAIAIAAVSRLAARRACPARRRRLSGAGADLRNGGTPGGEPRQSRVVTDASMAQKCSWRLTGAKARVYKRGRATGL
jgi:hypothetical protein